jgi:hypothetical protein
MTRSRSKSPFDLLSVALLGLTALACLCYTTVFFVPSLAGPFAATPPTRVANVPSPTPTWGLPPTWTPTLQSAPTETPTPFATFTPEATNTPRVTITPAPTRTKTVTPGPSPTITYTPSKYPYTAIVTYQPSPINACGSSYILGTITDLAGQPVTTNNMIIHVEGDGDIDTGYAMHPGEQVRGNRIDGPSPFTGMGFGPSAWNVVVNLSGTSAGTWRVSLIQGGQVSDQIEIRLESTCAYSAAVVRFQQNH